MSTGHLPPFGIFKTETHVIHSHYVDQVYDIGVWLPFSYTQSDRRYPVLYVLDGEFLFPMVAGMIPTLIGGGEVPEMIVVGIAYHGISSWAEFSDLRDRDYLPQEIQEPPRITRQAQYIDFFQHELIPLIEHEYRPEPDDRALFGFSSSGFFSMHMLLNYPGLFRRHIAASCTWPGTDTLLLDAVERYTKKPLQPPVDLYFATGALEEEFLPRFQKIAAALQTLPNLRLRYQVHDGEGHSAGTFAKTFLNGIRSVFS